VSRGSGGRDRTSVRRLTVAVMSLYDTGMGYLLTPMLKIVVHADDLAVSLGIPTPHLPDSRFDPVRDLLVRRAVHRHGQSAVISALARRERAGSIAAF
jgi:hypothetical protein